MIEHVVLIDDDPAIRQSLQWLLEGAGIALHSYATAKAFLADGDIEQAGCIILDLCMPQMSGAQLQAELNQREYCPPIIFLTGEADVSTTVRLFKNGAYDLLEKPVDPTILLHAIRQACTLNQRQRRQCYEQQTIRAKLAQLSAREQEILMLVQAGAQNKQIADKLNIALRTAEIHRHNMMKKMGCTTPIQLVQMLVSVAS